MVARLLAQRDGPLSSYQTMCRAENGDEDTKPDFKIPVLPILSLLSGVALFGYYIGICSNMITTGQLLCHSTMETAGTWTSVGYTQCWVLNSWTRGFMTSVHLFGGVLSSVFCMFYADVMGRRLEQQVAALLYGLGAVVAALSPMFCGTCLGFLLYGLGVGFAMHATPIYIAEICPAEVRGRLVSVKSIAMVVGVFVGFGSGFTFGRIPQIGWRIMIAISFLGALAMGVGCTRIPRSPRWLVLRAVRAAPNDVELYMEEAFHALQFFRLGWSSVEVERELDIIRAEASRSVSVYHTGLSQILRYPVSLSIGCGLLFFMQATGLPAVLHQAINIFKDAGFGGSASLCAVIIAIVRIGATMFTVTSVDKYGRRVLMFIGIAQMMVALATVIVAFNNQICQTPNVAVPSCEQDDLTLGPVWSAVTLVALGLFVCGFQVGYGSVTWIVVSEIFPLNMRGRAISLVAVVDFVCAFLITFTQQSLFAALGESGTFSLYFALCFFGAIFVKYAVPETKGLSLEEIEQMVTTTKRPSICGPDDIEPNFKF